MKLIGVPPGQFGAPWPASAPLAKARLGSTTGRSVGKIHRATSEDDKTEIIAQWIFEPERC
jgi:hypothetical protein